MKRLGTSKQFPQNISQIQDVSQYYDLQKVFDATDFEDENYLIEQMNKGTNNNFPDVIDGDQKSLIMLPDNVYHYGKGKDQVVIHIQQIMEKIKELEEQIEMDKLNNSSPISQDEIERRQLNVLEKDHMQNLADGLITEQAEKDVYHRFQELLHDEIGFMVHGYLPETYLQLITSRSKDQRKTLIQQAKDSQCSIEDYTKLTKLELNSMNLEYFLHFPLFMCFSNPLFPFLYS